MFLALSGEPGILLLLQLLLLQQLQIIIIIIIVVDFSVPADHKIKLKECEKRDKYLDLARELKKIWNITVKIVPIVIDAFGTVTKGLLKG